MTYAEIIFAVIANKQVFYESGNYGIIRKGEDLYINRETLKFFRERLSDMRLRKTIVVREDYQGKKHDCYVISRLQRNHPNGPRRTLAYFDVDTLENIRSYHNPGILK